MINSIQNASRERVEQIKRDTFGQTEREVERELRRRGEPVNE